MSRARELVALEWCATTLARIEFLSATALHATGGRRFGTPAEVAVRVEVLGFHPVVAPSLSEACDSLQRQIDATDEALQARQRARSISTEMPPTHEPDSHHGKEPIHP